VLAGALDDIALGITHAIQASERVATTAIQQDMRQALGADPRVIRYAHLPAIEEAGGSRTGRRIAGRTLRSLRNDGIEAAALVAYLARLGTPHAPEAKSLNDLAQPFDLAQIAPTAARFDPVALLATNRTVLGQLAFADVASRLPSGATETFWLAVRGKLDLLKEARGWWDVVAGTIVPPEIEQGREILSVALDLLPAEPWNGGVCAEWVDAVSQATRLDPDRLIAPLRLALTGEDGGPGLDELLPLMGRARAVNRLQVAATS
jgi:glutamyl-tRNA synthetase